MKQSFEMHLYADEDYVFKTGEYAMKYRLVPWVGKAGEKSAFGSYVGPVTVETEVPDSFDLRAAKLRDKKAELDKVRAEFTNRITEIQREIAQLQAIEYVEAE